MKIQINTDFATHKKGQIVSVKSNKGIPTDFYWRRCLLNAESDNCCQILDDKTPDKKAVKSKAKKGED